MHREMTVMSKKCRLRPVFGALSGCCTKKKKNGFYPREKKQNQVRFLSKRVILIRPNPLEK